MDPLIEMSLDELENGEVIWMPDRNQSRRNNFPATGESQHISKALQDHITISVNTIVKTEIATLKSDLQHSIQQAFAVESEKLQAQCSRRDWIGFIALGTVLFGGGFVMTQYIVTSELKPIIIRLETIERKVEKLEDARKVADLRNGPPKEAAARAAYTSEMKEFLRKQIASSVAPPSEAIRQFASTVSREEFSPQDNFWDVLPVVAQYASRAVEGDAQGWRGMPSNEQQSHNMRFLNQRLRQLGFTETKLYERSNPLLDGVAYFRDLSGPGPFFTSELSEAKVVGGFLALDGFEYKNTTFENVKISYKGGPISLINVKFVNCEFIFPKRDRQTMKTWASIVDQIPYRVNIKPEA